MAMHVPRFQICRFPTRALRLSAVAALLSIAGNVRPVRAQAVATKGRVLNTALTAEALVASARTVIASTSHAAFITLDASGHPEARAVQPVAPDSALGVWFATNPRSRKVRELDHDGRATLYYYDPASLAYVTLLGRARIVRSRAEKNAHWNPAWDTFYPDRDTSVVLVQFTTDRLEMVDIKRGISGTDKRTWSPPTLLLPAPRRPRKAT